MTKTMSHPFAHFRTISKHRHCVIRNCFKAGIGFQGLFHDLSKYSFAEFLPGAKYYQGTRSPNVAERMENGYSTAWMHHKGRNKHHFEYWTDYDYQTHVVSPMPMPKKYIAEMFCDRLAASKIYQGKNYTNHYPLEYFNQSKTTRFIHPDTSKELEKMLVILDEQGEDKAFAYIRKWLKE